MTEFGASPPAWPVDRAETRRLQAARRRRSAPTLPPPPPPSSPSPCSPSALRRELRACVRVCVCGGGAGACATPRYLSAGSSPSSLARACWRALRGVQLARVCRRAGASQLSVGSDELAGAGWRRVRARNCELLARQFKIENVHANGAGESCVCVCGWSGRDLGWLVRARQSIQMRANERAGSSRLGRVELPQSELIRAELARPQRLAARWHFERIGRASGGDCADRKGARVVVLMFARSGRR